MAEHKAPLGPKVVAGALKPKAAGSSGAAGSQAIQGTLRVDPMSGKKDAVEAFRDKPIFSDEPVVVLEQATGIPGVTGYSRRAGAMYKTGGAHFAYRFLPLDQSDRGVREAREAASAIFGSQDLSRGNASVTEIEAKGKRIIEISVNAISIPNASEAGFYAVTRKLTQAGDALRAEYETA